MCRAKQIGEVKDHFNRSTATLSTLPVALRRTDTPRKKLQSEAQNYVQICRIESPPVCTKTPSLKTRRRGPGGALCAGSTTRNLHTGLLWRLMSCLDYIVAELVSVVSTCIFDFVGFSSHSLQQSRNLLVFRGNTCRERVLCTDT